MGRTVLPASQYVQIEESAWQPFRRALRKEDQALFDDLFRAARYHVAAVAMAGRAVAFEAVLMAMLVELLRRVRGLESVSRLDI